MPLRASNIPQKQLRSIVILGSENYLRNEWAQLANFPDVYCLPGSPLSRLDLRAARVRFCSVCVVLGARGHRYIDDPYMLDKEVILCSLNIRAMTFPVLPEHFQPANVAYRSHGEQIPMITELRTDANIAYLDACNIDMSSPQNSASLTAPFARGVAFTGSVLDILASTAYFDRNAMTLIRHLVTGGVTPTLEKWFAEGAGLNGFEQTYSRTMTELDADEELPQRPKSLQENDRWRMAYRQRPRVALRSVLEDCFMFKSKQRAKTFCTLFCHAIAQHGILCLGVYRRVCNTPIDSQSLNNAVRPSSQPSSSPSRPFACPSTKCPTGSKQFHNYPRRLSTCAQPVEKVLREYTMRLQGQLNAFTSTENDSQQQQSGDGVNINENNCSPKHLKSVLSMSNVLTDRYVITSPPNEFILQPTDLIYCLCPFESD